MKQPRSWTGFLTQLCQAWCQFTCLVPPLSAQAFLIEHANQTEFVGNRTECALLVMLKK